MEVLHSEVEALRREGADLRRHNATLQVLCCAVPCRAVRGCPAAQPDWCSKKWVFRCQSERAGTAAADGPFARAVLLCRRRYSGWSQRWCRHGSNRQACSCSCGASVQEQRMQRLCGRPTWRSAALPPAALLGDTMRPLRQGTASRSCSLPLGPALTTQPTIQSGEGAAHLQLSCLAGMLNRSSSAGSPTPAPACRTRTAATALQGCRRRSRSSGTRQPVAGSRTSSTSSWRQLSACRRLSMTSRCR